MHQLELFPGCSGRLLPSVRHHARRHDGARLLHPPQEGVGLARGRKTGRPPEQDIRTSSGTAPKRSGRSLAARDGSPEL